MKMIKGTNYRIFDGVNPSKLDWFERNAGDLDLYEIDANKDQILSSAEIADWERIRMDDDDELE